MKKRAISLKGEKTSSFPSRAVVCAVVYTFTVITSLNYFESYIMGNPNGAFSNAELLICIIVMAVLVGFARVHLGAHYPSDCIVGFTTGLFICLLSYFLFKIPNFMGCPTCQNK